MKETSNFKLQFFILLALGIGCAFFLFSRERVVVNSARNTKSENKEEKVASTEHQKIVLNSDDQKKVDSLLKIKQANPKNEGILIQLAQIYYNASDFEKSAFYLKEIAENKPSAKSWNNVGDAYSQGFSLALNPVKIQELEQNARDAYDKALKIDPNNLYSKTKIAMTYVASDSPMKAILMLRQVLDESPNYEPALMNMGALSMQSRQFDKAEIRFRQVLKNNPANVNAKLGLAYSLMELGNKSEAKKVFLELKNQKLDPVIKQEVDKALNSLK